MHSDPTGNLILACDASPYGVGAVLSHQFSDAQEKPFAYTSHSQRMAEKKYLQMEEGLCI